MRRVAAVVGFGLFVALAAAMAFILGACVFVGPFFGVWEPFAGAAVAAMTIFAIWGFLQWANRDTTKDAS